MCDIDENENNDSVSLNKDKSKNESSATLTKEKSEDESLDTLEINSSSNCTGVRDQSDAPDKAVATELKRLPRSQKKRLKQELATQRKKEIRKEKRQLQKLKMKEKAKEEKKEAMVQLSRKELREEIKSKLEAAMICGQRICIDLSMENTMTSKEKSKLAQQLCRLYGVNKKADMPAHVYFAGFDKNGELYQECIQKIDGFEKYQVEMTEVPVLELFDSNDIIYLTPDATDMLEDLDKDKVYVIGGIVDESIIKNLSKQRADAANIPTYRLPIDRYMKKKDQIHFSQVLAINQVFEILVTYLSSKNWRAALSRGVPERKGYVLKDWLGPWLRTLRTSWGGQQGGVSINVGTVLVINETGHEHYILGHVSSYAVTWRKYLCLFKMCAVFYLKTIILYCLCL